MRFGTFHLIGSPNMAPAAERFGETLAHIALADELGFDSVWIAEHHFSNYGYSANPLLLIARASSSSLGPAPTGASCLAGRSASSSGAPRRPTTRAVQRSMRLFAEEVVLALTPVPA